MQPVYTEKCVDNPDCELRIGKPSWGGEGLAMKFTWFNSKGAAARGGEFPLDALPQMMEMAVKHGYLKIVT